MMIDDYNILIDIYRELQQELLELNTQIECNDRGVKEAEVSLGDFFEPDDFKVFSPRNKETIYRKEIERIMDGKAEYERQNRELIQKRDIILERVQKLGKILSRENRNLSVLKIQEEDRKRIARELHDTSLQNLTHLVHKLELCGLYIDTDPTQAKLELSASNKHLKDTIEEIRCTIFDLRPMIFDDLGIKASLERLLAEMNKDKKLEINADIDDVSCETNLMMVTIYRVVQESLVNIFKHANAKKVDLSFKERDGRCIIEIEDDGNGFQQDNVDCEKHFGISLMRERVELLNGNFKIVSEEGKGTKIRIEISLKDA